MRYKIFFLLLWISVFPLFALKEFRQIIDDGKPIHCWLEFVSQTEYNEHGDIIRIRYADPRNTFLASYDYDESGNIIHYSDIKGEEKWYTYDKNGNMIWSKDKTGQEEWKEYDETGRLLCEGEYKEDKLWNGKKYEYNDSEQIKIELTIINGENILIEKYNSDNQLIFEAKYVKETKLYTKKIFFNDTINFGW